MKKPKPDDPLPMMTFENPEEFDQWLEEHHTSSGVWLRIFKKASDESGITIQEALDEALCFGWIDGQRKKYDEVSYLQKYTPRRKRSLWSKRNTEHIKRLTELGKIKPSGIREVEKAKTDGRWDRAYDPPSEMTIPEDFLEELAQKPKAKAFFETLNKTNRYEIGWQLQTAKKPETRERRMRKILEKLSKKEKFRR